MRHIRSLVVALAAFAAHSAQAEPVNFPGRGLTVAGELLKPSGAGPFPAVVALHGCAGLNGKSGGLSPRHQDWASRLVSAGFMVLFPDSFGSRGAGPQCKVEDRVTRPARERRDDALAALDYLATRPDVKRQAISLLGWSNGGSTVLYAGRDEGRSKGLHFASAVAFYPGCRIPLQKGGWHSRTPLLILIGAADDWTPAAPCQQLAAQSAAGGDPVSIVVYPGAYHDFDHPGLNIHETGGLAFTADGGGSAHSGTDPAARSDALSRVPSFLAR